MWSFIYIIFFNIYKNTFYCQQDRTEELSKRMFKEMSRMLVWKQHILIDQHIQEK